MLETRHVFLRLNPSSTLTVTPNEGYETTSSIEPIFCVLQAIKNHSNFFG